MLAEYRKLVSDAKRYHPDKCASSSVSYPSHLYSAYLFDNYSSIVVCFLVPCFCILEKNLDFLYFCGSFNKSIIRWRCDFKTF